MPVDVSAAAVTYAPPTPHVTPPAPAPAPVPAAVPLCRNCDAPLASPYCGACGQRAVLDRLTVASLATDFAGQFLALDRGLWFTALAVLKDPGGVARRWLDGQRGRFVGPVGFLSFAAALLLLAIGLINAGDMAAFREAARPYTAGPRPFFSPRQVEAYVHLMYDLAQQELLLTVLVAVPFAAVARRMFRRTGANLAEVGVMTLYAFADACLLYLPLILLIRVFDATPAAAKMLRGWGTLAVYTFALVHATRGFFGAKAGVVLRTLVALGVTVAIFMCFEMLLPVLYVKLTVPR